MKSLVLALAMLVGLFGSPKVQDKELSQLEMFFFRNVTPVFEYQASREMEVRNPEGKVVAETLVQTQLSNGSNFTYQILSDKRDGLGGKIAADNLKELLEKEKVEAKSSAFRRNGFLPENYTFTRSENLGNVFQISLQAKKKGGLLINGMLFLDKDGKLLRSEGILTKNPSIWTTDILIIVTYAEMVGARVPVSYDSSFKIRFKGKWTMSTRYQYTSVNGVPVTNKQ